MMGKSASLFFLRHERVMIRKFGLISIYQLFLPLAAIFFISVKFFFSCYFSYYKGYKRACTPTFS